MGDLELCTSHDSLVPWWIFVLGSVCQYMVTLYLFAGDIHDIGEKGFNKSKNDTNVQHEVSDGSQNFRIQKFNYTLKQFFEQFFGSKTFACAPE